MALRYVSMAANSIVLIGHPDENDHVKCRRTVVEELGHDRLHAYHANRYARPSHTRKCAGLTETTFSSSFIAKKQVFDRDSSPWRAKNRGEKRRKWLDVYVPTNARMTVKNDATGKVTLALNSSICSRSTVKAKQTIKLTNKFRARYLRGSSPSRRSRAVRSPNRSERKWTTRVKPKHWGNSLGLDEDMSGR